MTNKSVAKMWTVVKKVKRETSLDKTCRYNPILFGEPSDWASQVKAVEQELQIESTDATFQNMTSTNLEAAAEMFIYLNMCPGQIGKILPTNEIQKRYQSWFRLYDDLFKNKSPDVIILTLNRLLTQTDQKHKIIKRNKVLFKTVASRLNLKYRNIQSLLLYGSKTSDSNEDFQSMKQFLNTEGRYVFVM